MAKGERNGKLLVVAGAPATGKSTFARRLSRELRVPAFCKDTLKESLAEGMDGGWHSLPNRALSAATWAILHHVAAELLHAGLPLILESPLLPAQEGELGQLVRESGAGTLTIRFEGELPVLYERFREREKGRHPVHRRHGMDSFAAFSAAVTPLLEHRIPREAVTTDATDLQRVDWLGLTERARLFFRGD